ncbi:hypothetical protein BD770DRAFT_386216 [Pilaira anomala]|nr:hypothetical protein BD770DRAFT_386216 [Pilaira anomala]
MAHTRSQSSSSSSTSFTINQPAAASAAASVPVSTGVTVITISEPQLPIPSPNPIYYGQQQQQHHQKGWFSDGASTGTDEMISSSSPLLLTPPQQKQQDEYSWMIDDVSGIMDSHPTLFNNQTTGNGSHNTFQNVTTENDPLNAWAYIESLEISNNENQFMHTSYNRNVDDWISSTTKQASHNDLFVMLDQQRSRQPLFEQNEQIMRRLSEPSDMVNSYYNII